MALSVVGCGHSCVSGRNAPVSVDHARPISAGRMPSSWPMDCSPCMKPMCRRANPDEATTNRRAVCGRTACTVRRAGRARALSDPYRQLAATPLATIDPEAFVDFTTIRPVVRLSAAGERTIRWPRIALWTWQPPEGGAGLLLFRGVEPQLRWRTYATLLLDVAARCGVQQIVSLGAVLADVPHTRPPRVTGNSTDPVWQARFEACGIRTRRSRYEGPTGIATIVMDAAQRRGMASCNVRGPAPHYLGNATNPAVSRALLIAVASLLDLEHDVAPFEAAVRAFRTQCDQAVANDAAVQAYARQ